MKKIVIATLVIIPIALLMSYGAVLFFQNPKNTDNSVVEVSEKEVFTVEATEKDKNTNNKTDTSSDIVYCTATSEKVCYTITCDTGTVTTIDIPAPGSVPYQCSDDSKLRMTEI